MKTVAFLVSPGILSNHNPVMDKLPCCNMLLNRFFLMAALIVHALYQTCVMCMVLLLSLL